MATFNNMDLNLLRVFQAIADERSLTLAGNRLHLSQPAVSYALGRLRQIFDDPLFIRTKEGMQPTPAALELAKPINRALQAVQDALRYTERFDPAASTRVFRASMTDVAEMMFLPQLCELLTAQAPQTRLQVEQVPPAHLEEALRTGQLDFAFGNLPALKPVTCHELLFRETYVCMMRKRPALPAREQLELDEFLALSHVLVESAESSHHQVENSFRNLGVQRKISLSIPHFTVLPRILGKSDLVATVPARIAKLFHSEHPDVFLSYELPVKLPAVDITLHWHPAFDADAGNTWLRQIVIDMLQSYGRSS
ncbi:LysR family transcriptional regulator [Herbaspirillum sp.]|jgi:DNA-binding transcriptional LysR family regulator|uniref:LysR family transcriptional regulator n=1 Tax=Herbaspirillum TaxID=963 RepID=UPI0025910A28|nr:LysR family transcriptional regulator [Herbaspirillum sp.]MCP3655622.1 LysR family transcriptional regulator [Herbaspirillum sp.]MCP3945391.1 LysR family transcriptional regulator [Herbaspirillum sp.]MCP4034092.1 LysR family transcriptional regulator [Herbaspirillum sp.]MCP4034483.1 LysR family transcriptional regulator [Herbaspirillum sp.]MCP4554634.1 LysR family transcriptional regulator [Herbaspirillum sp.]